MKFKNRTEAGLLLAEKLKTYNIQDAVVLAIPRGGVPIGYEIAKQLNLPLDIVLAKKIGHPGNPEYAIGSVSLNSYVLDPHPEVPDEYIKDEITSIRELLKKRYALYTGDHSPINIKGKTVIVVDDGIAIGNTLLATIKMLSKKEPERIVVVTPVTSVSAANKLIKSEVVDDFLYLLAPRSFHGVSAFYDEFDQVSDEEVKHLLMELKNNKKKPHLKEL